MTDLLTRKLIVKVTPDKSFPSSWHLVTRWPFVLRKDGQAISYLSSCCQGDLQWPRANSTWAYSVPEFWHCSLCNFPTSLPATVLSVVKLKDLTAQLCEAWLLTEAEVQALDPLSLILVTQKFLGELLAASAYDL